jgi:hypothetical protein
MGWFILWEGLDTVGLTPTALYQIRDYMSDIINKYKHIFRHNIEKVITWWYWWAYGWPDHRRCPQCAGTGKYLSEIQARYGDESSSCGTCGGTGKVRRHDASVPMLSEFTDITKRTL